MSENRIIELETKVSFQDKAIEELSEIVFRLDQKLERLERACQGLEQKLTAVTEQAGLDVGEHNEKPPHY